MLGWLSRIVESRATLIEVTFGHGAFPLAAIRDALVAPVPADPLCPLPARLDDRVTPPEARGAV